MCGFTQTKHSVKHAVNNNNKRERDLSKVMNEKNENWLTNAIVINGDDDYKITKLSFPEQEEKH